MDFPLDLLFNPFLLYLIQSVGHVASVGNWWFPYMNMEGLDLNGKIVWNIWPSPTYCICLWPSGLRLLFGVFSLIISSTTLFSLFFSSPFLSDMESRRVIKFSPDNLLLLCARRKHIVFSRVWDFVLFYLFFYFFMLPRELLKGSTNPNQIFTHDFWLE